MAVLNNKHVVLIEELEKYRDIAVNDAIFGIAKAYNRDPNLILAEFNAGENTELNESINSHADRYLKTMCEELNKQISKTFYL